MGNLPCTGQWIDQHAEKNILIIFLCSKMIYRKREILFFRSGNFSHNAHSNAMKLDAAVPKEKHPRKQSS